MLQENNNDSYKQNSDLFLRYGDSEIVININGNHDVVRFAFYRAHIVEIEALLFLDFYRHQNDLVPFHDRRCSRQVAESRSALLKLLLEKLFVRWILTLTGLTFPNVKLLSLSTSVDMKISPKK